MPFSQSATLTNFGTAPLNIASIVASKDFIYGDTCPAALPGGSSCTIAVSYKPTITGAETGTLKITDNAFTGTQSVALSGTGTAPVAGIFPASVTFQSQLVHTTSGAQFVVLSNTGSGPLTFSGSGISTSGDFGQTNNCGTAVLPATSCQITVTFMPTATGSRTGNIHVTENAGTQTVNLSGTGASAAPTVAALPESLVFPTEILCLTLLLFIVLIPFFGFTELRRVFGVERLLAVFFRPRRLLNRLPQNRKGCL